MKKNKLLLFVPVLAALAFGSCSKELKQVNNNPNNLEQPDAYTLLSNVIVSEFYNNANVVWTLGNGYNQYMTYSQSYYNQATRYYPVTNEPYWTPLYEAARDANILYNIGQTKNNTLLQAAALTLRSYAFAQLTELWGDIPFKQALKGANGTYTPAYDSQELVYTDPEAGILPSLRRADSLLKANPLGSMGGDLLFNAKTISWRKFINALRLRYLLRVSAKMNVSAEMQSIVDAAALMQDASQSATIQLPATTPYNFVSLTERSGDFAVKYLNSTLYDAFVSTGDTARISSYFTKKSAASGSNFSFDNYGGMPLLIDATADQANNASNFNNSFRSGSNPFLTRARIISYSEQEFILAEAALKGYISGDPAMYYSKGVEGAYAEIGLDAGTASSYLHHTGVAFDQSSMGASLRQIITQKWMANINNGFEGWIEYRRTGYPVFQTGGSASLNNNQIPSRFLYPTSESTINADNYKMEMQQMGGKETTNYKAWWEK